MFGNLNMNDMMAKMQEMQGVVEESEKRLENIYVKGESEDGKIRFVLDGNRRVKDVTIDEEILSKQNKEDIEDMLVTAFNKAIENADHVNENEMKSSAAGILPGMGG